MTVEPIASQGHTELSRDVLVGRPRGNHQQPFGLRPGVSLPAALRWMAPRTGEKPSSASRLRETRGTQVDLDGFESSPFPGEEKEQF